MPDALGLFLLSNDNDYHQRLKEVGLREAKRQGFELIIESAQNYPARQAGQIRAAISNAKTSNLSGVLVSVVRNDIVPALVHEAVAAGIDFVVLKQSSPLKFLEPDSGKEIGTKYGTFVCYVGPRQQQFARIFGTSGTILKAVPSADAEATTQPVYWPLTSTGRIP